MTTLAVLAKPIRKGTSVWTFGFNGEEGAKDLPSYFASNGHKRINCADRDELRGLYRRMIGYGYGPVAF